MSQRHAIAEFVPFYTCTCGQTFVSITGAKEHIERANKILEVELAVDDAWERNR